MSAHPATPFNMRLAVRPYTPGDLPALTRLVQAAMPWPSSVPPARADIEARWQRRSIEPENDLLLLPGSDGEIVAYVQMHERRDGTPRLQFEIVAHPNIIGQGLYRQLYELAESRAERDGIAYVTCPLFAVPGAPEPEQVEILTGLGFAREHRFWQMRLDDIGHAHPQWPERIAWRPFRGGGTDAKRWAELVLATFAETMTAEDVIRQMADAGNIPDGYIFAVDKSTKLEIGTTRGRLDVMEGAPVGYIGTVGVLPAYRNMGIAEALMRQMLGHLSAQGVNGAILYVSDSNTSARKLYDKMGWRAVYRTDHYWKRLSGQRQERAEV